MATAAAAFDDPVHDAQRTFRCALEAMARPAVWRTVPVVPAQLPGLGVAASALALTLLDQEVTAWLSPRAQAAATALRLSNAVSITATPGQADFAFAHAAEYPGLHVFAAGRPTAPEAAATLVLELSGCSAATGLTASGPGIAARIGLHGDDLPATFAGDWARQAQAFPLGVDVFLTAAERLAALPRSVQLEAT